MEKGNCYFYNFLILSSPLSPPGSYRWTPHFGQTYNNVCLSGPLMQDPYRRTYKNISLGRPGRTFFLIIISPYLQKLCCFARALLFSSDLVSSSSILVYHFCLHAQHFCSTWMTSCMQFKKIEG